MLAVAAVFLYLLRSEPKNQKIKFFDEGLDEGKSTEAFEQQDMVW